MTSTTMKPIRIAPSILAWDLGDLRRAVEIADEGGADQLHLDVIDGHFAPNITFGPGTVKALRRLSDLKFDTHLMISEPESYIQKFLDAGSDLITVHSEVLSGARFDAIYSQVRSKGKELGIAIKPATPLPKWAEERLGELSSIVVMTVNPGFSGQTMDLSVMPKLEMIGALVREKGAAADIEVDGGVESTNVHEVVKRGGNVLVAGAGVYSTKDPVGMISTLRENALKARGTAR
jgi:ribulose-phosphate 3-epimerase